MHLLVFFKKLNTRNETTLVINNRTSCYIVFKVKYVPKMYSRYLTSP